MAETQLELLPAHRPLLEKFGRDFFRAVPAQAGVYVMTGSSERVLYVGQSGNLRARLGTYKNACKGHAPRKTLRLVHAVESITWEVCPTVQAALLRENLLLRLHRPRFNRLNTYPAAYKFISLQISPDQIQLGHTANPSAPGGLFGAFKGHMPGAYAALLRLLWGVLNKPRSVHAFPHRLLADRPPNPWNQQVPTAVGSQALGNLLVSFLGGSSDGFLEWLAERLSTPEALHPFQRALQERDLEALEAFYIAGPRRNRTLLQEHGLEGPVIAQQQLDDLRIGRI